MMPHIIGVREIWIDIKRGTIEGVTVIALGHIDRLRQYLTESHGSLPAAAS